VAVVRSTPVAVAPVAQRLSFRWLQCCRSTPVAVVPVASVAVVRSTPVTAVRLTPVAVVPVAPVAVVRSTPVAVVLIDSSGCRSSGSSADD